MCEARCVTTAAAVTPASPVTLTRCGAAPAAVSVADAELAGRGFMIKGEELTLSSSSSHIASAPVAEARLGLLLSFKLVA
jgi:hypothetical protein